MNAREVLQCGHPPAIQADAREAGVEVGDYVPRNNQEGDGEADPEESIVEDACDRVSAVCKITCRMQDRVCESLVIRPLLAQHDRDRD